MTDNKYLSVEEFAAATGTTTQNIYKHLNGKLSDYVIEKDKKYIAVEALELFKDKSEDKNDNNQVLQLSQLLQNLVATNENTVDKTKDSQIEALKNEIEFLKGEINQKNAQISDLLRQNEKLQDNINASKQIELIAAQKELKLIESGQAAEQEQEKKKKGLFSFFKKND